MKEKIICVLMLTLILTSALSMAFIIKPSFAENGENSISSKDFMEKKDEATLSDEVTKPYAEQEKTSQSSSQTSRNSEDKWNFNDTSEWAKFAYLDGNRTRLIVGAVNDNPASLAELEKIAAKHHAEIVSNVSIGGRVRAVVVELSLASVTAFVEDIRTLDLASYVEPNMKVQAQLLPNDPYWTYQWGPQKIEADWAWNTTIGDPWVLVAVVDTGIDYYHSDLAANYVPSGYDWVNRDADPMDDHGHGTHCAGIIAAVSNNGVGIAGLAQVRVMAEKVLDSSGGGTWDSVANGIINATDSGANIISMSLAGYGDSELVHEAVRYAYDAGVLVIAAAGNDNTNMKLYPAGYDEVIAVAATDQYDNKAGFSNWGDWIELAAPGVDIYSTVPWGYESWSGTSMATPHVSGVAALVWSRYPSKTRDWVRLWLRYAADDLGDPGFDAYYGYGRVNARKAVEQTPSDHELIAYEWRTPPYVKPGATGIINATILNFGEENETDVAVQLLANDTMVAFTIIDFLASGDSATVSLAWNPAAEGLYNVTLYVVPVPGETSLENNGFSKSIYVGFPVKAAVLHSAGNVYSDIITNWQVLTNEWYLFGDTMVYIDYTTLNKEDITYEDIVATEADVLIISCASDPYAGWQFTDSEIDSIKRYVYEGHGLIATAGTFYNGVPNNNKLAPLFGLNETTMWSSTGTDLLHLVNTTHPIFTNVPNPLIFRQVGTALPYDGRWDSNELAGGKYLALGHYEESAVVVYRGLVYVSPWLEVIPPYYRHHLQLLYNAITWSRYQKPQHELAVSLESPKYLQPSESVLLNATVLNNGLNSETDVELYLSIDDTVVNATTIAELLTDSSCTINYLWTPTVEATYNVTAYAPPVPSEEITVNNQESKFVGVFEMVIAVVLDSWGTDYGYNAFWDYLNTNWANYGTMRIIIDYTSLNKEDMTLADIEATQADVLIISDAWEYGHGWEFADSEIEAIETYVRSGHGIIATSGTFNTMDGMAPNNRKLADLFGMDPDIEYRWGTYTSGTFDLLTPRHDELWRNIPDPYLSDSILTIYPYPSSDWTIQGVTTGWIEALSTDHYATVIASDAITHKAVYFTGMLEYSGQYNENNRQLFYNAIVWTQLPLYEHELAVSLEAPDFLEPGDSVLLNATVRNRGLSNETSVELQLLVNGTIVDFVLISELLTGASYTLTHLWTPTVEGIYNVTAYAPPVSNEEYIINNVASVNVKVRYLIAYVAVLNSWDIPPYFTGGWSNNYQTLVDALNAQGFYAQPVTNEEIIGGILDLFDVFVMVDNVPNVSALPCVVDFWSNGGGIVAFDSSICFLCYAGVLPQESIGSNGYYVYWDCDTSNQARICAEHPITAGYEIGQIVYGTSGDAEYRVDALAGTSAYPYYTILVEDVTRPNRAYVSVYEPPTSGKVVHIWDQIHWGNIGLQLMILNAMEWTKAPRYDHDLAVTLNAPKFLGGGESTLLNATVRNRGLSNETDVELQLLINGTVVDSMLIPELLTEASCTLSYLWTPSIAGVYYNVTAYAVPVLGENFTLNNRVTRMFDVSLYRRIYLPHEWIGGGDPMGWHADDASWQYTLPFDFPFYGINYRTIYISSNGLITFIGSDASWGNSIPALAGQLAIAPAWDDWVTYDPYDIYIWQNSTNVGIRWYVAAYYDRSIVANFETILSFDGVIQFNYGYNNGTVSATLGISNGVGDILAEDATNLNYINTIVFIPFQPEHELIVYLDAPQCLRSSESVLLNATVRNRGLSNETDVELKLLINSTTVNSIIIPELLIGTSYTLSYLWTPIIEGTYNVTAYAPPVTGEEYTTNNVVTKMVKVGFIILFDQTHGTDSITWYSIWITSLVERGYVVENLTSGLITPEVLEGYDAFVIPQAHTDYASEELSAIQDFVAGGGGLLVIGDDCPWIYTSLTSFAGITWASGGYGGNTIDITPHPVTEGVSIACFSSPTSFMYVTFPAIDLIRDYSGYTMLAVSEVEFGKVIGIADEDSIADWSIGYVDNLRLANNMIDWLTVVEVDDVAVTDVAVSLNMVHQGWIVGINVAVANLGNATETFTVTLYYDSTVIAVQNVQNLEPNATLTLSFAWNTTCVPYCHNYTIKAVASAVPGETNTDNNTFIDGQVKVKIMGDVNGDGVVDGQDLQLVKRAIPSAPDDTNWNPQADINNDGVIDGLDYQMTKKRIGRT